MAWIETVTPDDAEGLLAKLYKAAIERAGRVFGILRLQSINPKVLRAGGSLYHEVMRADSPLTRAQREMIAVVVSAANSCHY